MAGPPSLPFGAAKTLDSSGNATSDAYTPSGAGNYNFRAVYAGAAYFAGSQSADIAEPLVVAKANSTTATLLSASSTTLGESVTDAVTVTGSPTIPTGSVIFQISTDGGTTFIAFGASQTPKRQRSRYF